MNQGPRLFFSDFEPEPIPGDCDMCPDGDVQPARFWFGEHYFCGSCLIDIVKSGAIAVGAVIRRVPVPLYWGATYLRSYA